MPESNDRRRRGIAAETCVASYLEAKGFQIADRNVRVGALELDLIATKGRICVVCEVRSLRSAEWVHPAETITSSKRDRVRRAALQLMKTPKYRGYRLRLDVASVIDPTGVSPQIEYYEDAL